MFFWGVSAAFLPLQFARKMRMTMRILILVGASVRGAACSAAGAGYEPYSIDLFADRDLAALGPAVKIARYPADFLAALAEAPSAPWMYTGGLENYPRVVDRLAISRALLGNRGDVLRERLHSLGDSLA